MATLLGLSRLVACVASNSARRVSPLAVCKQYYPALRLWENSVAGYRTRLPWISRTPEYQQEVVNYDEEKEKMADDVIKEINRQIATDTAGRLFAVVSLCGKQFKITEGDLIVVEGFWPPQTGDELKLEKVLVVGSRDFSLIGRPLVNRELVSVDATVIEKTLSHTKTRFRMQKRKQFKRINFYRVPRTMLRINNISINDSVDKKQEFEGLDRIY